MKKLILDLDTGVDDALAISYALGSPEVELIGITGTYGNVLVEQGVRNALAVTDPSSIAWIFNIRGSDVPHTPHPLARAIIPASGRPQLFLDKRKTGIEQEAYLTQLADFVAARVEQRDTRVTPADGVAAVAVVMWNILSNVPSRFALKSSSVSPYSVPPGA